MNEFIHYMKIRSSLRGCNYDNAEIFECDKYLDCESCLEDKIKEHDKKIRADTIEEFVKAIEKHQTRQDSYLDPPYVEMGLDMTDVLEVAEQLKEQK